MEQALASGANTDKARPSSATQSKMTGATWLKET
jgi:hypothetical protein